MCLRRVLSRWARLAGLPFDLATRLTSSLRSFLVRLASTRSRPFFTSQTETAQTIVQGTRFQTAPALRLAIHRGIPDPTSSAAELRGAAALRGPPAAQLALRPALRGIVCGPTRSPPGRR